MHVACPQELRGEGPHRNETVLGWAVQLLGLVLEPHEAQAMYSQLFGVLARAARTEQLAPSQSAYAGPYPAVALAGVSRPHPQVCSSTALIHSFHRRSARITVPAVRTSGPAPSASANDEACRVRHLGQSRHCQHPRCNATPTAEKCLKSCCARTAALLWAPASRQHMLADHAVMERLEALLTRKLVTGRELRTLVPTVWWAGAQSQAGGDSRVSQLGFAAAVEVRLSAASSKILEKAGKTFEKEKYLQLII